MYFLRSETANQFKNGLPAVRSNVATLLQACASGNITAKHPHRG